MAFLDDLLKKIRKPLEYFNPTSNQGQNFWSTKTAQRLADVQKAPATRFATGAVESFGQRIAKPIASLFGEAGYQAGRYVTDPTFRKSIKGQPLTPEEIEKLNKKPDTKFLQPEQMKSPKQIAKTGRAATTRANLAILGLANPTNALLTAVLSGILGYGTAKLSKAEDPAYEAGKAAGYAPVYAGINKLTGPSQDVIAGKLLGKSTNFLKKGLTKGAVYGTGNVLEDILFTPLTELRKPTAGELAVSGGTGLVSGVGSEAFESAMKQVTRTIRKIRPKMSETQARKAAEDYVRNEIGQFTGLNKRPTTKAPTPPAPYGTHKDIPIGLSVKRVSPEEGARLRGELKPTRKEIPPNLKSLAEEARKYKSAGEFVRKFPDRESFFLSKNLKWQKSLKGFEDLADGDREFARYGNWFISYDPVVYAKARYRYQIYNEKGQFLTAADTLPRAMAKIERWGGITKSQLADFYNQATKGIPPIKIKEETPTQTKNLDEILSSSGYSPEQIASIPTKEKQRIIKEDIPPFSHQSFEQQVDQQKIPTPETLEPEQVGERVAWSEFTESEGQKGLTRLFNRLFNPLKNAPEEVQQTANAWRREVLTARADANALSKKFSHIPDEDGWKMVRYIQNPTKETAKQLEFDPTAYQKEIKELRKIYDEAREEGLQKGLDIGYLDNYINQVWQEPLGSITTKTTKIRGAGARPYFTKKRVIPSYEEGLKLGLTPRFTHPAQLAAHYREALAKAVANKKLVDDLVKSGYLVPAGDAPLDWQPITAPFFPKVTKVIGKGETVVSDYKAPPNVAEAINSIFEYGSGQHSGLEEIAELGAKVSRAMQEVTLSGGFGPANAFTYGQMIKEVTSGRVKSPVTSFFKAFSDKSTKEFFQENQPYQRMMAEEGIPLYTSDDYTKAFKNLAENKTLKQKLGDAWDKVFNEATFKRFMPMLETNFFKDTYEQAIKSGLSHNEAKRLAGEATKHFYGIADAFSRSKFVEDTTTAGLFAPKFRESMVNFWVNNAKALLPKNIKDPSYNTNRKFLAGTVITYLLYTATNKALTGHWMHENKGGKKLSVEIPVGDDRSLFIPMLPSVGTLPRRAGEMAGALLEGDVATAAQKAGSFLSQPISLGSQLLSNRTFYGAPIYQSDDPALTKLGKLGGYALEESSHPLVGEPIAVAQGRKTPFEAGLGLMEMPAYPSASTPEKPLPLARVADTQTLAAGQPGTLAKTTEEERPSFLERIFSLRKKEEPLRELPTKTEELAIVYGDARKALSNYDERRTRIEYGQYTSENKRRQALTELEQERAYAQAVLERIEAEKPEQVFEIGLQTYATGEGMSVEERSEWAAGELGSSVDEAEFSKKLEAMLEAGVITKDVATALREEYGLPVYKYKSGGKIVSAGGTSKGDLTKILNAIQSDYEARRDLYQSMAAPSSQTSALETILKLYGQRGATTPPTSSSLEEILATRRRMEPIAKIQ